MRTTGRRTPSHLLGGRHLPIVVMPHLVGGRAGIQSAVKIAPSTEGKSVESPRPIDFELWIGRSSKLQVEGVDHGSSFSLESPSGANPVISLSAN